HRSAWLEPALLDATFLGCRGVRVGQLGDRPGRPPAAAMDLRGAQGGLAVPQAQVLAGHGQHRGKARRYAPLAFIPADGGKAGLLMRPPLARLLRAAILVALAGCFAAPGSTEPSGEAAPVWPAAPDKPRIAYVNSFSDGQELGIRRSFLQRAL